MGSSPPSTPDEDSASFDRFDTVDRLFERALELEPAERPRFLDQAGLEDPVRNKLERLLAAAEAEGSGLHSGDAWDGALGRALRRELAETDLPDLAPGSLLGRCRILREIGRGGMAVVYLAERSGEEFKQLVALKVLKRGLDSEEILRRFAQERRILASARHPGLARLLDGGMTADGRPYLVMEHVEGRPIDEHCDAERLTLVQRVRLFLQVARAVEAAHRSLVVHRDIKPSNVLVTAEGHVKLLDFGIAKLLDSHADAASELTTPFTRLLTPAYASPEQLAGEPVTTASDVYQLGLLLTHLLAGGPPLEPGGLPLSRFLRTLPAGRQEELAAARSTTPARLVRTLKGDLETVAGVSLRPEPERRYGSAGALIADLERYLDGRPLAARADTFAYRLRKRVRRHRGAVATGALAALLLAATGVASFVRVTRERDRAELAARRSAQTTDFLRGLFRVASPSRSRGEQITARELLERGVARLGRDPGLPPELRADLLLEVGGVYRELALYAESGARLREAVAIRRQHPGPGGRELATALLALAETELELNRLESAERFYGEVSAIHRRPADLSGPERPDPALASIGLGRVHAARANFGRAVEIQAPALARLEAALGAEHEEVGRSARHLARSLRGLHRSEEARRHLERALKVLEARLGTDHAFVATTRVELAEVLSDLGERAAARSRFEEALPVLERVYPPDHPALAHAYTALADLLTAPGPEGQDAETAISFYRKALPIRERAFGADHPQVADVLLGLGRAYPMAGRDSEAREPIQRALAIFTRHSGAGHIDLAVPLLQLAKLEQRAGNRSAALDLYRQVVALRERHLGPKHASLILPLYEQAKIHRAAGEPAAALPLLGRILDSQAGNPETQHGLGFIRVELGRCLTDLSRFAEAERKLLPLAQAQEPHSRRRAVEALVDLYRRWGKGKEEGRWRAELG